MNKYVELIIDTNLLWSECLADILIKEVGCAGVVTNETQYKDEVVIKQNTDFVKGYIWYNDENKPDIDKIQATLYKSRENLIQGGVSADDIGTWKLAINKVEDEEWAHSWKKFWHPQKIGSKIVICPSWEEFTPVDSEIKIDLDPGTAFGTGSHATTRLCILALEKYLKQNDTLADIGMGSGILAVCGLKLGASSAVGVDNDPSVIEVAKLNATKNLVAEKCNFYEGSASNVSGKYDIVVANILAEIIVSIMYDLVKLIKTDGKIIFSGIIAEKANLVKDSAEKAGLTIKEVIEEDNWVAIVAG